MPDLRVFISSTFRDLQDEREHLVKKIFPEIRALCRERGITFTEIDLRWGLTDEQSALGTVIRTCLEEIDKCRPYFIGIIGNRYGWAPAFHEVAMDADLFSRYPWIEEAALDETSITEMEFIHGLFHAGSTDHSPGQTDGESVYFYRREGERADIDDPERLQRMIDRASSSGHPMRSYDSADSLGEMVRDDLLKIIERYWPDTEPPSPLEVEQRSHAAFSASRRRAYIVQPDHLKFFNQWSTAISAPLLVAGESGLGKSSLVAFLVEQYRKKNPNAFVIEHYVGASHSSGTSVAVMNHIIEEIRSRFSIDGPIPSTDSELVAAFPNWLFRAQRHCSEAGVALLIAIDAVNQLDERGRRMTWLPGELPSGIWMMVSTIRDETYDLLHERNWVELQLEPLADERVRASIVVRCLAEFRKHVSAEQLKRITSDAKASSPLYLRVVAEELRLHGQHETIDHAIDRLRRPHDLEGVFQTLLERLENDHGRSLVEQILSLLWVARSGLGETELLEMSGTRRIDLSRLLFALDFHLIRHDGLLGFFHNYLREAVEHRYLSSQQSVHAARSGVTAYFERSDLTLRSALELMWQYSSSNDDEKLAHILSRPDVLRLVPTDSGRNQNAVVEQWTRLISKGYDMPAAFASGLASVESAISVDDRAETMRVMATLMLTLHFLDEAEPLSRELIALGEQHGNLRWQLEGHRLCGAILENRSQLDEALAHHEIEARLAQELNDPVRMNQVQNNIGMIYTEQGRYTEAIETLKRTVTRSEELNDRGVASGALFNLGRAYGDQGNLDEAMKCYERCMTLMEDEGDQAGIGSIVNNVGLIHLTHGRFAEARECFQRKLAISESLGDRYGILAALGNTGSILEHEGRFQEAIDYYSRSQAISEEIGNRIGVGYSLGCIGTVYQRMNRPAEAIEYQMKGLDIHRSAGHRRGCITWLVNLATIFISAATDESEPPVWLDHHITSKEGEPWRESLIRVASEHLAEIDSYTVDMGDSDLSGFVEVCRARLEATRGENNRACTRLKELLARTTIDSHRSEILYWLWNLARGVEDDGAVETYRVEALRLFTAQNSETPTDEALRRIQDLESGTHP